MPSDCGDKPGEVFMKDGVYMGDFRQGLGGVWTNNAWYDAGNILCGLYPYKVIPDAGPKTYFALQNASTSVKIVDDPTGPKGLEHLPALEVNWSGAGADGAAWVGKGWTITANTEWNLDYWVKAVPSADGYPAPVGVPVYSPTAGKWPSYLGFVRTSGPLVLDGQWQFWHGTMYWPDLAPFVDTVVVDAQATLGSTSTTLSEPFSFDCGGTHFDVSRYVPNGTVRIKCAHLYPTIALPPVGISLSPVKVRAWEEGDA